MTTTTLTWKKKKELPEKDCSVLVLCEWNFANQRMAIFQTDAKEGKNVSFNDYRVIAWAEVSIEEIELGISNNNFNADFVNFLHNNIKNL